MSCYQTPIGWRYNGRRRLLCAGCIANRASELPGVIVVYARLEHATELFTTQQICCSMPSVTSQELKRWLTKQGCTFEPGRGGHLHVRRNDKIAILPMHGKGKELGTGLVNAIKTQLGLK